MSVGFKYKIVLSNNGKIADYQKSYDNNYDKEIRVYFPLQINNKKNYKAILSMSINNTFPKQIESVIGVKDDTDLNCYIFNVSELYVKYKPVKKIGLSKVSLLTEDGRPKLISESFRF